MAKTSTQAPAAAQKARVLATSIFGAADEVVEVPADVLAQGVAAGLLDPHPDAVAYAESLRTTTDPQA